MTTRIDSINERRARRQTQQAQVPSPLPDSSPKVTPDVPSRQMVSPAYGPMPNQAQTPVQVAGSRVDTAPEKIAYANSGITPTMTSNREYRQGALQNMDEEQFRRAQDDMNASDKEYWSEQARLNPLNTYANLQNYFASEETPDERRKRERREHLGQVFANLGNLIGNAAQLYYTAKGAVPADLNAGAFAENERMRRIKEKRDALQARQDAILAEAKGNDIRNAYNIRLAREKAAADAAEKQKERDLDMAKFGIKLKVDKDKDDANRKETERHNRAMEANASQAQGKVLDSGIGSDGYVYTRNTKLSANETIQFVKRYLKDDELAQFQTGDKLTGKEETDWDAAAAYILQSGRVPADELAARGFIRSGKAGERPLNGWGYDTKGLRGQVFGSPWSLSAPSGGSSSASSKNGWSLNN
ncbi:hypothetical protein M3090_01715 [Bacteroides sp. ET71]|uniref:hypothetical protein n=1 Tax=Bacteroides sp. ET71 TaxID=2939421 RepID=UPI0020122183|nr:hypothetical protein [Bacteroides sp. ET71]MCL1615128.1 hypothetical protein [Bacteroides sp. ET71]